jgi:hypothetical protein
MAWKAWKFRVSGLLTWAGLIWDMHEWRGGWNPQGVEDYENPWLTPASPWGNGAIAFYYPPNPQGAAGSPDFTLVPSLRWELFREGMEDYEYFCLLRSEIERASAAGIDVSSSQETLQEAMALIPSKTGMLYDPSPYRERRDAVAAEILRLRSSESGDSGNFQAR